MNTENLLIELGTEELPPKQLKTLAVAFKKGIGTALDKMDLDHKSIEWFATPRRLAVRVNGLSDSQQDKLVEKRGPAIKAAFDNDGNPTKAALGWAKGCGIAIEDATTITSDKGEWLVHKAEVKGRKLEEIIDEVINNAIDSLPINKGMRWGDGTDEFIRPVHTLIVLYGDKILPVTSFGLSASNQSLGHRFHHRNLITVDHANNYETTLKQAKVIVNYEERKDEITRQITLICDNHSAQISTDNDLLDEVCSLVEWPVALVGHFEERFLQVPAEALIYTMKDDQKYFPLLDGNGNLLSKFVFISNIESKDPQQVIAGNEKVVRPRLSDAEFFYNVDKKATLESRLDSLDSVLFQKQLGTMKDKCVRISVLAEHIAKEIGANSKHAHRAGLLSKADLMTEVVMEFTDVQGIMGKYYALNDGEDAVVAEALYQQYLPRFAGDELPDSLEACSVALADKFDTLVGIFGIGQHPKGVKDPFALRRAAIGVIRIMVEKNISINFEQLAQFSASLLKEKLSNNNVVKDVVDFILGRFQAYYLERGISVEVIRAVEIKRPTSALDFDKRLKAVVEFAKHEDCTALAAANKRVNNILAKNDVDVASAIDESLLVDEAEKSLVAKLNAIRPVVLDEFELGNYELGLRNLASLRGVIDGFFDNVMVMHENPKVKNNRLAILVNLQQLFMYTADISVL